MWFTSLQLVKIIALAAGLEKNQADLIIFLPADYTGNARAKPMGKKGTLINHREIIENYEVRGILPRRLVRFFCQDFLQCVKPVGRRISRNKLGAYPAINFRL